MKNLFLLLIITVFLFGCKGSKMKAKFVLEVYTGWVRAEGNSIPTTTLPVGMKTASVAVSAIIDSTKHTFTVSSLALPETEQGDSLYLEQGEVMSVRKK